MAWIKTIPMDEADDRLTKILEGHHALYPPEYREPTSSDPGVDEGILSSHTLIPDALHHAFATFGVLMSPDLPLTRQQHEMITTIVSATNRCQF